MKNIEALVTDLETSKQLQEAGIKYETAFVWVKNCGLNDKWTLSIRSDDVLKKYAKYQIIPTYTAGELMQVLPESIEKESIEKDNFIYDLQLSKYGGDYVANYFSNKKQDFIFPYGEAWEKLPQQALAKLCLWCRKEGYL